MLWIASVPRCTTKGFVSNTRIHTYRPSARTKARTKAQPARQSIRPCVRSPFRYKYNSPACPRVTNPATPVKARVYRLVFIGVRFINALSISLTRASVTNETSSRRVTLQTAMCASLICVHRRAPPNALDRLSDNGRRIADKHKPGNYPITPPQLRATSARAARPASVATVLRVYIWMRRQCSLQET